MVTDPLSQRGRRGVGEQPPTPIPHNKKGRGKKILWFFVVVVLAVVAANFLLSGRIPFVTSNSYWALFLTNGQVYFGKLSGLRTSFPTLEDVYYLRVTQALQQQAGSETPNINLVKLGNELHRPKDFMKINRDHVLFAEELESVSAVVAAIEEFKASQ